jgi:arabinofuranosyltransferase
VFQSHRPWILASSLLVLGIFVLINLDHTVDDAFIGFRYAENLVRGQGLVFNPGERVEGYTNFLWVILMAPFIALSGDPETDAKALGCIASALTLAAVVRFGPSSPRFREVAWVAPIFLATSPAFALWTTAGMETPLYTCLLTWAVVLAAEGLETGDPAPVIGVLLGAAALTRPEGAGIALVLGLLSWRLGPATSAFRRALLLSVGAFLLIFLPYFLWRWSYYGRLLPNTYYAKVGDAPSQMTRGLVYTQAFFAYSGYWLLLPLAGLLWYRQRRAAALLGGLTAVLALCAIVVGGDALPMFRFLVPLLPAFFLLLALGAAGLLERLGPRPYARLALGVVLFCFAAGAVLPGFTGATYEDVRRDLREVSAWKEVGAWLRDHAAPTATIAVIPAGAIPYYSKLRSIDMLGLNDATIAHRKMPGLGTGIPGHEKFDIDYVLSRRPDIILLGIYGLDPNPRPPQDLVHYSYEAEWRMLDSPRFRDEYQIRRARAPDGYFPYFLRAR